MRVLLDECVPRRLRDHLTGHEVRTLPEMGWAGRKNGALLRLANAEFDAFVTTDQNLRHQQNLDGLTMMIAVLVANRNKIDHLLPLVPALRHRLAEPMTTGLIEIKS